MTLDDIRFRLRTGHFEFSRHALHLQVCYSSADMVKIVTVYDPAPNEWIDYRVRRRP